VSIVVAVFSNANTRDDVYGAVIRTKS